MACGHRVGVLLMFVSCCLLSTVHSMRDENFGQAGSASTESASLTGLELLAQKAYQPEGYSIDELVLRPGDFVQVTNDHLKAGATSKHYVFGVHIHSGHSGWFPASHAVVKHGSSSPLQPGSGCGVPCKNSFFSGWGSGGMKVFPVHTGDVIGEVRNVKPVKKKELIGTVHAASFESSITDFRNKLKATGNFADHTWRIYATAGLLFRMGHAKKLWSHVRQEVTSKPECVGLFAECDNTTNKGR